MVPSPEVRRAITTGHRSAAQNGQDSSLTNTTPGFPSIVRPDQLGTGWSIGAFRPSPTG